MHHLESWHKNKDKRLNVENLVTLCKPCHVFFHQIYGQKNNNINQFLKFKSFFIPKV